MSSQKQTILNVIDELKMYLTPEQLEGELVRWFTADEALNFYEHIIRHWDIPRAKVEE